MGKSTKSENAAKRRKQYKKKLTMNVRQKRHQMDATIQWINDYVRKPNSDKPFRVLALDLSYTATGYCLFEDGELLEAGNFGTTSTDGTTRERNRFMYEKLGEMMKFEPDAIGFEAITVWTNPSATHKLIYVETELYHAIVDLESCDDNRVIPLFKMITVQIKKVASGDSKSDKAKMLKEVLKNYGVDLENDDQADAFCIGVTLSALPKFVDHYITLRDAAEDRDIFLRDFDMGRFYDESLMNIWIYEVLIGMTSGESGDILRSNDKELFYRVKEEMKGIR